MPSIMHQKTYKIPLNIISQLFYTFKKLSHNLARCPISNFLIISAPILAFFIATLQLPGIFQHTSHLSHIQFQHTLPNTLSHRFYDHPEIPTHFLNLCWKLQHKTYFSDALFQHTFYKRRRGTFAPLPICLPILPTHSSHLLLYSFTDAPQKVFQHIHSIDGSLPGCNLILYILKFPFLFLRHLCRLFPAVVRQGKISSRIGAFVKTLPTKLF